MSDIINFYDYKILNRLPVTDYEMEQFLMYQNEEYEPEDEDYNDDSLDEDDAYFDDYFDDNSEHPDEDS